MKKAKLVVVADRYWKCESCHGRQFENYQLTVAHLVSPIHGYGQREAEVYAQNVVGMSEEEAEEQQLRQHGCKSGVCNL